MALPTSTDISTILPTPWARGVFVAFLENRAYRLGSSPDYPVMDKLKSLGVADRMSVALCATDPEINAFKPYPKWISARLVRSGACVPTEVLYVGDRPEVDAMGALNAGMPCVILAPWTRQEEQSDMPSAYKTFSSFARLQRALL